MAVKAQVGLTAKQPDTPIFDDHAGKPSRNMAGSGTYQIGQFLGKTTGDDLLDGGVRWVKIYQETVIKAWIGPATKVTRNHYWVDAKLAKAVNPEDNDWLQEAAFVNEVKEKPRPIDDVERERLAAAYTKNYPTLPAPDRIFKEGDAWYYSFKTGKVSKVSDFSDLSLLDQQTLAGAQVGASFSGLGLTKSDSSTGAKKPNYLLIGGIALGSIVFAVGAWFLTRSKGKQDKKQ